ncbi:MAG: hypothetical protein IJ122_09480 [Methanobrevibacter sp.]|nr:hypothetical protein [Methanobrevibacter sp.]
MNNNFSLRQNMQIPQKRAYVGLEFGNNLDEEIEELSKHYEIHNIHQVKDFIRKNEDLVEYIKSITPIIDKHFPDNKKCLTFCEDSEFEELDDITIFISCFKADFDRDWKQLDVLEKELCYLDGFSTKLKGLISVDLWVEKYF